MTIVERIRGERRPTIRVGRFEREMPTSLRGLEFPELDLPSATDARTSLEQAMATASHALDRTVDDVARGIREAREPASRALTESSRAVEQAMRAAGPRGRPRARTASIGLGILVAVAGSLVAAAVLLDRTEGERRRATLARRARGVAGSLGAGAGRVAAAARAQVSGRPAPLDDPIDPLRPRVGVPGGEMVPVMDPRTEATQEAASMPVADRAAREETPIGAEPRTGTPDGAPVGVPARSSHNGA